MKREIILCWVAALSVSTAGAEAPTEGTEGVSWEAVRAELGKTICVIEREHQGDVFYAYIGGQRQACGAEAADSALARAVDRVLAETAALRASLDPSDVGFSHDPGEPIASANKKMRDAYLGHDRFTGPILRRLADALATEGLHCVDCPEPPEPEARHTTWQEVKPYVTAHVWPSPVRTPVDEEGRPTGKPRVRFHVCAGINGIRQMEDPDPLLTRAGFLAVFSNRTIVERARDHLGALLASAEYRALEDDQARTSFIRQGLAERLGSDPAVRESACEHLARYRKDLGLVVEGCAQ